MSFLNF